MAKNINSKPFDETTKSGIVRKTTLSIESDVLKYMFGSISKCSPIFLKPKKFEESGVTTSLSRIPPCSIKDAYDMIHYSVFGVENASKSTDILEAFIKSDGNNIKSVLI